ncbi:hypothetical protein MAJ_10819, partial [Metarhizium majus ARSEF 297]
MKYSMLSVAAFFAAFSLGSPAYYWRMQQAEAGEAIITNDLNNPVDVVKVPGGPEIQIAQTGGEARFPGGPSADLKINGQVEVSYVGGNQGTFNYEVKPIAPGFVGCVQVSTVGCNQDYLEWCSQPGPSPIITCPAGTELPIRLTELPNVWNSYNY